MTVLRQLLAHAVIVAMTAGGVACRCPAEAAGPDAAVASAKHGHRGADPVDEALNAGCGHPTCGADCDRASAAPAKSKATKPTAPARHTPTLDDVGFVATGFAAWPEASSQSAGIVAALPAHVRAQDSPVRRFDRLLD